MEAPENLVNAVSRLKPRAMLLLDTNTIMNAPYLDSYEINAQGRFLLVVPRTVYYELMGLKLGGNERKRRRASHALDVTGKLYARDNPAAGIDLGNDRWLITVKTPSPPDSNGLEDDQVRQNLGKVDAALLRLAAACAKGCPDTRTVLITEDKNLTHVARVQGLPALKLSDLRSREVLEKMLLDARPGEAPSVDFSAILDSSEERPVKIVMKLEELRSEGDYLIARGSGYLVYDERRSPFRWTFPYKNLASYKGLWNVDIHGPSDEMVMPLENVDFMGADEGIPEGVRRFACRMLEESGGWAGYGRALQSPLTMLRFNIVWYAAMNTLRGHFYRPWGGGSP